MAWRRTAIALVAALAVAAATCAEASASYGGEESKFTVTGTVLCQDCTKNWNAYAYNGKPIPGSVLGVACLDKKTRRTVYYGTDATDGDGKFRIEVPYAVDGCSLDPSECLVRLVSSGDQGCAIFTDFNGGKTGERPSRPSKNYPGEVTYEVGPYYCTVPQCDVDEKSCHYG